MTPIHNAIGTPLTLTMYGVTLKFAALPTRAKLSAMPNANAYNIA
jgi:hypothetical protein